MLLPPPLARRTPGRAAILLLLAAAFAVAAALLPGITLTPAPPAVQAHGITGASSISITSTPTNGVYNTGDAITVRVTFPSCVQSTGGSPGLTIGLDSGNVTAGLSNFSASQNVNFSYTVTASDYDGDGITIATNALAGQYNMSQQSGCSGILPHNSGHANTLPNTYASAQSGHLVKPVDYDTDNDGLIEIGSGATGLQQLNSILGDANGDGNPVELSWFSGSEVAAYNSAFPGRQRVATTNSGRMGCPTSGCTGYELTADLTFDTNGDGEITSADTYQTFTAIGNQFGNRWTTTFDGNGHTISYMRPREARVSVGMFGIVTSPGHITGVGLLNVEARHNGVTDLGALVGQLAAGATVSNSYSTGSVSATGLNNDNQKIGGLVGRIFAGATVRNSWSSATVTLQDNKFYAQAGGLAGSSAGTVVSSYATGAVSGGGNSGAERGAIGGLIGVQTGGAIAAAYATGNVASVSTSHTLAGGLLGAQTGGTLNASYSTGTVSTGAQGVTGGLVARHRAADNVAQAGTNQGYGTITNSYWDQTTSGIAAGSNGVPQTTAALQSPTDYTGIYLDWNVNVAGSSLRDDPWHFDTADDEYPVLKYGRSLNEVYDQLDKTAPTAPVDYDTGAGNDLIEVSTIAQLNAIRFDLDGSGADGLTAGTPAHTYYHLAFPGATAAAGIGCTSGAGMCDGYELAADLDFANTGWAQSNGWAPIGPGPGSGDAYTAVFHGQGHTISNLTINSTNVLRQGLFGQLHLGARVEQLGLLNVNLDAANTSGWILAGALAGSSQQSIIRSSYATGTIDAAVTGSLNPVIKVGGLVGSLTRGEAGPPLQPSQIVASWADVAVTTASTGTNGTPDQAGGLVGEVATGAPTPSIIASYAAGAVAMSHTVGSGDRCVAGGLAGRVEVSSIIASYSIGAPSCDAGASGTAQVGGLIGLAVPANANGHTHANSYWDTAASDQASSPGGAAITGKTTSELQAGLAATYSGDFANWNVNVDGQPGNDDPWDFGTASQYPILKYNYNDFGQQMQRTSDHDSDGDGLLQVDTLAKLDAIRHDLTGAGDTTTMDASARTAYRAAFPNHARCAPNPCTGYELTADLDFDTAGDDDIADAPYANWTPLPAYSAAFDGNGHTISNLRITDAPDTGFGKTVGLFVSLLPTAVVTGVGLPQVHIDVSTSSTAPSAILQVGALAGDSAGTVRSSWATGTITAAVAGPDPAAEQTVTRAGGLVGEMSGSSALTASWANVTVSVSSNSGSSTADAVGGLAGRVLSSNATVSAAFARGNVSADRADARIGGLIGSLESGSVTAAYATGQPTGAGSSPMIGGLIGSATSATVNDSYWDTDTSMVTSSAGGANVSGQTTRALQTPATYAGIYANWNVNVDGDTTTGVGGNDDPWHFGASNQYPILKFGHHAASYALQLGLSDVDYDADDDNLIDVTNLHQLHAIRYDADGNGMVAAGDADAYALAYPAASTGMGCPDPVNGCIGYELLNDLDFDTAGNDRTADFPYANWAPLPQYTATFDGGGHTIANLNVDIASSPAGLFARLNGASGVIRSLGLLNPTIRSRATSGFNNIGALVGENNGGARIYAVYVSGGSVTSTAPDAVVGGLAGRNTGSSIIASYAISAPVDVSGNGIFFRAGGLVGGNYSGSTIRASWAASPVANTGASSATTTGGLVGYTAGTLDYSYHDGGIASGTAGGTSQTNLLLVGTDSYTDIYQDWNVDVDGDAATGDAAGNDDPWDFGGPLQYPLLTFGFDETGIARQRANLTFTDYDLDGDNLIEVDSLAKLNAIRWDADGNGAVSDSDQANYAAVYPRPLAGMGCAAACTGYELEADLDFDTGTAGDRTDDLYYNGGAGWTPLGQYTATFDGNGHTISNLHINRSTTAPDSVGLFSELSGASGIIRSVGLINPDITAASTNILYTGALVGDNDGGGQIYAAYVSGGSVRTTSRDAIVGGLVGRNNGSSSRVVACYALNTAVDATDRNDAAGGLVGGNYAGATITASYAASVVDNTGTNPTATGGLVGSNNLSNVNNSYYDSDIESDAGEGGSGQTTSALQTPAAYGAASGDVYYQWNVNVDGDTNTGDAAGNDDPWDFAANYQYPILKYGFTTPAARAAQLDPQDPTVTRIAPPANVDRIRQTGAYAYLLEVDSPVTMVALPTTLFTTTQTGATVAAPTTDTTGASVGGDDGNVVTLGPGETPTVAVIRITSPNGRSTLDYTLTIQRIFCPKASLTGPSDVVGEGGIAEFTVLVCGPTAEDVVVSWRAEGAAGGGAAAADSADLSGLSLPSTGTVTVPAGHDATAVISFPIADDADAEGSESFTVTLTGAAGGTERYDDDAPATATIALSDPTLNLRAPQGTGAGESGNGAGSDTPLTASSRLIITEGAANAYTMQLESPPGESVTVVIHSNHEGITTTPDRVTFTNGNYNQPQRVTVNAAPDGDDNNESATLTHILTDADGGLIEIIDRLPLFVADTDPPEDDDIC